ncbi:helix-turn-helix protein [Planomicrobium soli]|uniref:Helix-turn-helix protein n=1 Tax=Planomicrobium soli TaxID=1176648 RepID=A0A2P8H7G6_9BACL|nr:helix-turn-helix transcriptional regulator [Planomicrobium soli]PSL42163.1 helix-turn-helix protein [Planomicrobium soli]
MEKSSLKSALREVRGNQTQQQMALELNVSRELVSKIENGTRTIPPDVSQKLMQTSENARFAFALRHEYTKTGPVWLDGPDVDLHHASVKEKTIEEMEEVIVALRNFNFARSLKSISHWERQEIDRLLQESVEAITALEHLVVVLCENMNISYTETWGTHYQSLRAKGWLS